MTGADGAESPARLDMPVERRERVAIGCNPPRNTLRRVPDTPWARLRGERGWSIRDLAERTGINRGDLSRFERGRGCPTPAQARLLLAAYDGSGS